MSQANVVLIHGSRNQEGSAQTLENTWLRAINSGSSSPIPIEDDDAQLAYYAKMLYPELGEPGGVITVQNWSTADLRLWEDLASEYAAAWQDVHPGTPNPLAPGAEEVGTLDWPWGKPGGVLEDAVVYSRNPELAGRVDELVSRAFDQDKPNVVVAHSLGSVIVVNVLTRYAQERGWNVPLLVTIGSPLWMKEIRKHMRLPANLDCVEAWINYRAGWDPAALEPFTAADLGADGPVVVDREIDLRGHNRHAAIKYLGHPAVATAIHTAWQRTIH